MSVAASLALAVLAYTMLSIGFVLMKKGIGWIGRRGPRDAASRRALRVWLVGFILMNAYIVPSAAALKTLPPHVVGSMAGWGVVVLVFLSRALLREELRPSDPAWAAVIAAGIVVLSVFERGGAGGAVRLPAFAAAAAVPFALATPGLLRSVSRPARAALLAAAAGVSTGLIVLTMKILVAAHGFRVADYLASPYFYAYVAFSVGGFLALQAAYKMGDMMSVGPVQYSAAILYPVLGSAAIFGRGLQPVQTAAVAAVVIGAAAMLRRRPAAARPAAAS